MTREDVADMLTLLRVSYPNFYSKMPKADMMRVLDVWTDMFINEDVDVVKYALYDLIATHTGFPPDIAAVKNKIKELCNVVSGEETDEGLWITLKKAVRNGLYGAAAEYEKLPPVLQRYLGSPSALTEYAMIDTETFNTVNHGQFLKQIKIVKEREEYSLNMPDNIKLLISGTLGMIPESRPLTEIEFNERRYELINQLESGNDNG